MKASQILPIAIGVLPTLINAQASWTWSLEAPEEGVKDLTIPMSVKGSAHKQHFYYAFQFPFKGVPDVGYTGLQPQADADGKSQIRGVFSSFNEGTTTDDTENCSEGADGGPGVSCGFVFPGDYDQIYNIVIKNTADTTWTGTAVNTASGEEHHLGRYTLPSAAGGISGGNAGFAENYVGQDSCDQVPKGGAIIGDPFSTDIKGSIEKPGNAGDCTGDDVNLTVNRDDAAGTWTISFGF